MPLCKRRQVVNYITALHLTITESEYDGSMSMCELLNPTEPATFLLENEPRSMRILRSKERAEKETQKLTGESKSLTCLNGNIGSFNCGELLGKNFGNPDTLRTELDFQLRRFANQCNSSIYWTVDRLLEKLNAHFEEKC